jgi:hypothetical protein
LRVQLNNFYAQQAQIKYLFYNVAPIPISQAPRLALVFEREQKRKEQATAEEKDSSLNKNDENKLIQDQRINSFEDIYGSKKPIALSKLFEKQDPEDIASNKILILGRAGIGKTTLCQFIAYEWSQGRLWNERYDSLFWIPLRNLNKKYYRDKQEKGEQITLAEVIFQECCQTKGVKSAVTLADIQRLLENNQTKDNVLLLGDGWDEIAQLNQKDTPMGDLLNELLAWEHVILTSRPYAIPDTVQDYKRLENIGFLDDDIKDYVNKFFAAIKYPSRAVEFLAFIKQNPLLWGSAHIPIILELMCSAWNERKNQGKALNNQLSMTDLYEELVLKLCKRYLMKRSQNPLKKEDVRKLRRQAVLEEGKSVLEFLAELAFEASKCNGSRILIDNDLIQKLRNKYEVSNSSLFDDILESHFLKNTGNESDIADQSFYFVHLTFQEYFTAYYIVQQLKQNNPSIIQFIKENKYTQSFEVTWWFVAGLLRGDQQTLGKFFDVLEEEPRDIIGLYHQMLLMRCMDECDLQVSPQRKENFFIGLDDWVYGVNDLQSPSSFLKKQFIKTINYYLSLSPRVFNQPRLIKQFVALLELADIDTLSAIRQLILPLEILDQVVGWLENASYIDRASQILVEQSILPQDIISRFNNLLQHPNNRVFTSAAKAVSKQMKLPEEALKRLMKLLFNFDKSYRSISLDALSNQTDLPSWALDCLFGFLEESKGYPVSSVDYGVIAKKGKDYASYATQILSQQFKLPQKIILNLVALLREEYYCFSVVEILNCQFVLSINISNDLLPLLRHNNKYVQLSVAAILSKRLLLPKSELDWMVDYLFDDDNNIRSLARNVLCSYPALPSSVQNRLSSMVLEKPSQERIKARVLGAQTQLPLQIQQQLGEDLLSSNYDTKSLAVNALENQIALPKKILSRLSDLLRKNDSDIVWPALRGLLNQAILPLDILSSLVDLLREGDYPITLNIVVQILIKQNLSYILKSINASDKNSINSNLLIILILKSLAEKIPIYAQGNSIIVGRKDMMINLDRSEQLLEYVVTVRRLSIEMLKGNIIPLQPKVVVDDDHKQDIESYAH